jgi:hypothetical protein
MRQIELRWPRETSLKYRADSTFLFKDFCDPNPCLNGGSCIPSIWTNKRHLITCKCPPGYDGLRCEHKALDVCSLPMSPGMQVYSSGWFGKVLSALYFRLVSLGHLSSICRISHMVFPQSTHTKMSLWFCQLIVCRLVLT